MIDEHIASRPPVLPRILPLALRPLRPPPKAELSDMDGPPAGFMNQR